MTTTADIVAMRRTRLREWIDARYGGTQQRFIDATGINQGELSALLSSKSFGEKKARKIEAQAKMPDGYLVAPLATSHGLRERGAVMPVASSETAAAHHRFPLLEGYAGMGRGDYVGDYPEVVQFVEVTQEWAAHALRGVPSDAVRVITGRGPSMRGVFDDGDLVFLDSRVKQFAGDAAYCFRWNGLVYIKRLQRLDATHVRILSANADYPPVDANVDEIEIGGRALAAWTLRAL